MPCICLGINHHKFFLRSIYSLVIGEWSIRVYLVFSLISLILFMLACLVLLDCAYIKIYIMMLTQSASAYSNFDTNLLYNIIRL